MDVLGACRLQIDFEAGVLRFLETLADEDTLGSRIPIAFSDDGSPFVAGSVDAVTVENFLIDTGAQGNSLGTELFEELQARNLLRLGHGGENSPVGRAKPARGSAPSGG